MAMVDRICPHDVQLLERKAMREGERTPSRKYSVVRVSVEHV